MVCFSIFACRQSHHEGTFLFISSPTSDASFGEGILVSLYLHWLCIVGWLARFARPVTLDQRVNIAPKGGRANSNHEMHSLAQFKVNTHHQIKLRPIVYGKLPLAASNFINSPTWVRKIFLFSSSSSSSSPLFLRLSAPFRSKNVHHWTIRATHLLRCGYKIMRYTTASFAAYVYFIEFISKTSPSLTWNVHCPSEPSHQASLLPNFQPTVCPACAASFCLRIDHFSQLHSRT